MDRAEHDALLAEADARVERLPAGPGTRELKTRLDRLRRAVDAWGSRVPTEEQRAALQEQIEEVIRIARASAPTLRRPAVRRKRT
jgi:hypothetical protein